MSRAGETDMAPYVSLTAQRTLTLTVPPINVQRGIGSILGALDDKIELNRRTNETLEELARTIFKSWFVDFDPVRAKAEDQKPVGMDAETAALFPNRFVASELGEIPEGWKLAALDGYVDFLSGFPFKSDLFSRESCGLRLLKGSNVAPGRADWTDAVHWPHELDTRMRDCWLSEGDIILAMDRPWIPAGLKLFMVGPSDLPALLVQRVARLRGSLILPTSLLYLALRSESFTQHLLGVQTGSTVPHISKGNILEFRVALAGEGIGAAFDGIVSPICARILHNRAQNQTLAELRDILLPKLISGELRVPEADKVVEAAL
jgi:type I restriction enzyme S subunit